MFGRRHDPRIDALAGVPFFSGCGRQELETVAKVADEASFASGEMLMREGEIGHEAFVLLRGDAVVTIGTVRVATLHPGDIVGEMALIEHEPRSATVVARDDVESLVLTNRGFNAVLDASPNVAWRVMTTLAQRLRKVQAA